MRYPFYELDVYRLNFSRAKSSYVTKFLKFFLTFRAYCDIIHNVKRERDKRKLKKIKISS